MKKKQFVLPLILVIAAMSISACSIHENYHGGSERHPWSWHYPYR